MAKQTTRILLAGGGSGGHVTPLRAIIAALQRQVGENLEITVFTDRGFFEESQTIFKNEKNIKLKKIFSGKYRRYKSKSFLWHIAHIPTFLKNIRDLFLLMLGFTQSLGYFLLHKPDVVFCKGGFVCVPIGMVARLFKVPLVIHDSDTRPGLTNRILARWADKIGTGMPEKFYPYSKERMQYTGIPVHHEYQIVNSQKQADIKKSLGLSKSRPLLLVTGGGKGAANLNKQMSFIVPKLIENGWTVINLAGRGKTQVLVRARQALSKELSRHWIIEEFADMLPRLLAADLIICRTSASTIQEAANAQKTVIGVASQHLDDQKMNASFFASEGAIIALDEAKFSSNGRDLLEAIEVLRADPRKSAELAQTLHRHFAKPHAADELAALIIDAASLQ